VPTKSGTDADRTTILGGWSVAIPAGCKDPETAWKFVKFLTRSDVAAVYTNTFTGTQVPAERFAQYDASLVEPHQQALTYAKALQTAAKITNIRQAIFDNLQLALTGDLTPEEAIAETSAAVDALLK
jgi:multiple sugar transport system substrate-binding protein